jgi:TolB-like protein
MALRLETLGGLRVLLHDTDRPALTRQYLRCGLLVHLAVERRVPREKVLSLLWPERAPERARHALSQMLYELRRDLGGDWVTLEGDVVTAADDLTTDAIEFRVAIASGDTGAVRIYRGPFLDAVRLADTPEFETWVELRRGEFSQSFRDMSRSITERLKGTGRLRDALAAARRWALAEPLDEEAQHGLIELLARSGLRNEALRLYEEYRGRLGVLGVDPGEMLAALVGEVRSGSLMDRSSASLHTSAPQLEAPAGVVVLPFEDMSPGGTHGHFCDGLAEEIISGLSRVRGLRVVPRTSAFAFRGTRIAEAATALGVSHAVEGSARFSNGNYRVTVRLIDAGAEEELWQDQLGGTLASEDVFSVQERIAEAVTHALRDVIAPASSGAPHALEPRREPPARRPTSNADAYQLYLRGRQAWYLRTPQALWDSLELFERATGADAEYAQAHAGIADVYSLMGAFDYALLPPSEAYPKARDAAERSLALDPTLASAHATLGNIHVSFDWDLEAGEARYRTAIDLDPGYSIARQWYSTLLLYRGYEDEALTQAALALELDPRSAYVSSHLARLFQLLRQPQRAAEQYRHALTIDPGFLTAHLGLALAELSLRNPERCLERLGALSQQLGGELPLVKALWGYALGVCGRTGEARGVCQALKATAARYLPPEYVAMVYLGLGEADRAFGWLERAFEARSQVVTLLAVDPMLDPVRNRPEFLALLARAWKPRATQQGALAEEVPAV